MTRRLALLVLLPALVCASPAVAQGPAGQADGSARRSAVSAVTVQKGRERSHCRPRACARVRTYLVTSPQVPPAFDGARLLFVSDTHLASRFGYRQLPQLRALLARLQPDALLLGGDYQEGCQHVPPLLEALTAWWPPDGAFAVLGNNDLERCTALIREECRRRDVCLLDDSLAYIVRGSDSIAVAGVTCRFHGAETTPSPTRTLDDRQFAILLAHSPDYADDQDCAGADLILAGHTHGGQVTLFGWAPVTASRYGRRFLRGCNDSHQGIPVVTTNGIGTSRRNVRLFAPAEVVLITLAVAM